MSTRVWITVAHPWMSMTDHTGDMVRLRTMAAALRDAGCAVELITWKDRCPDALANAYCAQGNGRSFSESSKRWLKCVVPLHVWNTIKDLSYRNLNESFYRLLISRTNAWPELIIDYNFYFNDAALRLARQIGVPIFLNLEGFVFDTMAGPPRSWLRSVGRQFELRKYAAVNGILAVSKPLKEALLERLGSKAPPIHVIPNAVQVAGGHPPRPTHPNDVPVVGFVGSLSPWYAIDRLIETCARIRRGGIACRLVIVGDGPERARLEAMIARLDARRWCRLTGLVPHDRVADQVAQFDIGVITNHKWWTSPLKLLEYGAQALPVVAPDIASITSMVGPDEVVLFDPDDRDAFESALTGLLTRVERRLLLGHRLHQRVLRDYGRAAMTQRLVEALGLRACATAEAGRT